jgi:protein subunit release factor B
MTKPILTLTKKDMKRQTFRCGGKGGQNVNKVETGVRFIHEASGCVAESCTFRHQHQNEVEAFKRLIEQPKMQKWLRVETLKRLGQCAPESMEEMQARVNKQFEQDLRNGNILVETYE